VGYSEIPQPVLEEASKQLEVDEVAQFDMVEVPGCFDPKRVMMCVTGERVEG